MEDLSGIIAKYSVLEGKAKTLGFWCIIQNYFNRLASETKSNRMEFNMD